MNALLQQAARQGPQRFSAWNAEQFDQICAGPAAQLLERLSQHPQAEAIFAGWLLLVQEAVGLGRLQAPGLLHHGLLNLAPHHPPTTHQLALLWNLCEGLAQGPPWLAGYIDALSGELSSLSALQDWLIARLQPALAPAHPARWSGPFHTAQLDCATLDKSFLPGEMALIAPRILTVADRLRPQHTLSLFLEHGGKSKLIPESLPQTPYSEEIPPARLSEAGLSLGEAVIALPLLGEAHRTLRAQAGFVVVSAVDSQRLWVVDSP